MGVAEGSIVATVVAVGGAGVKVAKGVEGTGVGILPTGSIAFWRYVLHTS
jgi:hypothetical protein